MLNLVWKDVAAARRLLLLVIPLGVLQLAVTASVGPFFLPAALFFAGLLAFGSIPLEEVQRTEILWNSLPVTRAQIVLARYVSVLLGILAGLCLSWAVGQVTVRLIPAGTIDLAPFVSLQAHILLFVLLALVSAVFLPLYFCFGAGHAVIIFSAVALGGLVTVFVIVQAVPDLLAQVAAWLEPRTGWLPGLLVGLSAFAMALSWLVAWRLYETRDL